MRVTGRIMNLQHFKSTVQTWLKHNAFNFRANWSDDSVQLFDALSQKQLTLNLNEIKDFREAQSPQGLGTYINVVKTNNAELILCHAGIAFSPYFNSTDPLDDTPPVVCMQDYHRLYQSLFHLLQERERKADTLKLFQLLISILNGAKLIGLNVEEEERQLDQNLTEFETNFNTN